MRQYPQFKVVSGGTSQDVIVESDLVVVVSSTTGLEACVADKPLIVVELVDDPDSVPYASYGAALKVSVSGTDPAGELTQAITHLQTDPSGVSSLAVGRRRLLDDMLNGSTGNAVEQAAMAVAQLLGRPRVELPSHGSGE